jgi:hypothetical protein
MLSVSPKEKPVCEGARHHAACFIAESIIEEDRFGFEPEFTAKVAKLKLRIYETVISYSGRGYSEGKKIGWRMEFQRCVESSNTICSAGFFQRLQKSQGKG